MRRQQITLDIVWDEDPDGTGEPQVPDPRKWLWRELLDLAPHEGVTIVESSDVTEIRVLRGSSSGAVS